MHVDPTFSAEVVESSSQWLDELRRTSHLIRTAERRGRLRLRTADIGPVEGWGVPKGWSLRPLSQQRQAGLNYSGLRNDRLRRPDAVLVDGRFRVASALSVLPWLSPNATVIVHDFFVAGGSSPRVSRSTYTPVLRWYHAWRLTSGTMAVMHPRRRQWSQAEQRRFFEDLRRAFLDPT